MEGLPLCTLEIVDRSENFKDFVTWNKDQKTLTSIQCHTRGEIGSSDRSLCGAPEAFEGYKGKNLRVKLNGKQVTLSVRKEVPTYNDKGQFQIAYSKYREGWFTKEVFFEVQSLAGWVYSGRWKDYRTDISECSGNRSEVLSKWLTGNEKSWFACDCFEGRSFYLIKTTDASPEKFHFKYLNEDFALTLYDECAGGCVSPFRFSYGRKCYFGITSFREHDKEFFETLIRKITYFLTLLFGKEAVTNRIYESNDQQCRWDYNPSEKEENSPDSLLFPSISYDTIHDKFGDKLTKWFEVCGRYEMIIDSFFRDKYKRSSNKDVLKDMTREEKREEKEIMKDLFLKRLNRLEMYGNILTEGCDASKDIEAAVSAVDNEVVSGIISEILSDYAQLSPDGKSFQYQIYNFGKTPEDKKKDFVKIVTAFRNYFVHPFRDGKKKTPFGEGIEKFFTTAQIGSPANFAEATHWLSQDFSIILYCVLLQSKSVKENKGVIKSRQNLFPETNHTREDYGKIILKYVRQCLNDKETSKTLKWCVARIKNILLFSREEATRRTSDGENSESRCINVVLTENNLKCLSDILTELTWRCEKDVKEAFEKNEKAFGKDKQQKNIWALRPIYECFMHDFSKNSERLHEGRKNLGELIINLKNSFDPNVNSLFCERFTDYKNAEVNFKAFARLSDTLSDILRRLLLQEAGLTEFFGKKMNA